MASKGIATMFVAFEVICAVVVVIGMFQLADKVTSSEFFNKQYIVEDISLYTDTLYAMPGNVLVQYPGSISDMAVSYEKDIITVSKSGTKADARSVFAAFGKYPDKRLKEGSSVKFTKIGNVLTVDDVFHLDQHQAICPPLNLDGVLMDKTILIDPGHGGKDKGDITDTKNEAEINRGIGFLVESKSEIKFLSTRSLKDDSLSDAEISVEERIMRADNSDIVISIHTGSDDERTYRQTAKIIVSSDDLWRKQSTALACYINKNLKSLTSLTDTTIEYIDPSTLSTDDPKRILALKIPGVYVEIGNILYTPSNNVHDELPKVADAIKTGLEEAFTIAETDVEEDEKSDKDQGDAE